MGVPEFKEGWRLFVDKPTKANERSVRKLVDALESGGYTQARGRLFDGTGHCCLGVACRVAGMEPELKAGEWRFGAMSGTLPEPRRKALGLRNGAGIVFGSQPVTSLTGLNDDGATFKQIARFVRQAWKVQTGREL